MLSFNLITTEDQFLELQSNWNNLLSESDVDSIFLSHEWFHCCLEGYRSKKKIYIFTITEGPELLGIAPLWKYDDILRGIRVRKIGFISSPESPQVDFILNKYKREEILELILHRIFQDRSIWDVMSLEKLPIDSPNYLSLRRILKNKNVKKFVGNSLLIPYIPIEGDWKTFLQSRSVKFRKSRRNINNKVKKLHNIEIKCVQQDIAGNLMDEVLLVSDNSWKKQDGIAISSRDESKKFFMLLTELASSNGWLFVWLLKKDGVPIAMEYDLCRDKRIYALRADFNEEFKKYSPGTYLEYNIIKHIFESGYVEYNTGGGLNSYKLQWTDKVKEHISLNICNHSLKGNTIFLLESKLLPLLRKIRDYAKKRHEINVANEFKHKK